MARPGIEPRTSDLRVRCPTDYATLRGPAPLDKTIIEIFADVNFVVCLLPLKVLTAREHLYFFVGFSREITFVTSVGFLEQFVLPKRGLPLKGKKRKKLPSEK